MAKLTLAQMRAINEERARVERIKEAARNAGIGQKHESVWAKKTHAEIMDDIRFARAKDITNG